MASKVFCLILNYNRPDDTLNCARSLLASALPPSTHLLIIDNGPKNLETFFRAKLPSVAYLKSPGNLGFAGGNNQGIRLALSRGATHILLINPDVTVPRRFLYPLLQTFKARPCRVGLVAPAHTENGRSFGLGGHLNWRTAAFPHDNVMVLPKKPRRYDLLTFACVLIKSEVFEQVGLLDERYFLYLEDVDYCVAASRAGFTLLLNPLVTVVHRTSSSFADPRAKIWFSFRSAFIFIRKWYKFPANLISSLHTLYFYPKLYILWTLRYWKKAITAGSLQSA